MEENEFSVKYILENCLDKIAYGFVYITTNMVNNKKYIGQRMFVKDWKYYLGSGKYLKLAFKKYSKENFSREIIAIAYSRDELNILEIMFIKKYNAVIDNNYYNILEGGGGSPTSGTHYSDELKKKISNALKGKRLSEETKRKIGDAERGEKHYNYGKKMSDETRFKLSQSHMGKIISEETREKISKSNIGRFVSESTRIKIGSKHKGKIISEETRKKLSEINKKFNDKDIVEIRAKYSTGIYSQYSLAKQYLTSQSVINNVVNCKGVYKDICYREDKINKLKFKRLTSNKAVICSTTNKMFQSINEANIYYGLSSNNRDIGQVCKGKAKSSGSLLDGTRLTWMYLDKYLENNK